MNAGDMNPETWARIQELFNHVIDLDEPARSAFLAEACGDEPQLRRQIEDLLRASEYGGASLEALVSEAAARTRTAPPETIGPYKLLRLLGEGGMGSVYLAERADAQYRQLVAVKIVKHDLVSEEVLQRFLSERQILANLNHPNIARLLDGGTTDQGLPYLVMEYVEGEPIDEYCDRHRLSTKERLGVLRQVCAAVHVAHQNLVVHRDIKPSNILVLPDGTPKLLDFGIAKLLSPGVVAHTIAMTRLDMRVMTPLHASPEQVLGKPITTASDVYALGVLMYHLLTGQRPYRLESDRPGDIERAICDTQPAKPSAAVGQPDPEGDGPPVETLTAARSTTADRLRRLLSGDLDNIVLKALRKEPQRRYGSARELSDDIDRYLRRMPVQARPDSWRYRAAKYLQRNAAPVGTAAVSMIVLAVMVIFYTLELADQRDRARLEAEKSEQIAGFLVDIFEVSDPYGSRGGESVTARSLLDLGADRIDVELAQQPVVRARMLDVIGRVYHRLGVYESANELLQDALALRIEALGHDHPDTVETRLHIGQLALDTGMQTIARRMLGEVLDQRRAAAGEAAPEVAEVIFLIAQSHHSDADYESAESLYRQAIDIYRAAPGTDPGALSVALSGLAANLRHRGDYAAAEALYREALELTRRAHGERHPDVAHALNHLARLYHQQGSYASAEPLARQALELRRSLFPPEHPSIAASLGNLANILRAQGDLDEAETLRREVLALLRGSLGDEHRYVAAGAYSLGTVLVEKRDYEAALPLLQESLLSHRKLYAPDSPNVAHPLVGLGQLWIAMGEPRRGEPLLREALEILRAALPAGHRRIAEASSLLGEALLDTGRYREAEPLLKDSHAAIEAELGAKHSSTVAAGARLERLYRAWGGPRSRTSSH